MHDPALPLVECVSAMHAAAIVPHDHVADGPIVIPGELGSGGVCPQRIEQFFRFLEREPVDIRKGAAAKIERIAPRLGVGAYPGMAGAEGYPNIAWKLEPT